MKTVRDYQPKKNNPWHLPKHLYKQTLCLIRDYNRLKEDYEDAILPSRDSNYRGSNQPSDPTGTAALRIENMHDRIRAVERAKKEIPEEYQQGVWQNIIYGTRYPEDADRRTYGRWKARFVYLVAKFMGWE